MKNKAGTYRQTLGTLADWEPYLLQESGLPGPRGNLELAQVVADAGDRPLFEHFLAYTPEIAPTNDPHEFLAFCGVLGLGRLLAEGDERTLAQIRPYASDPRWRLREAVAMALQRLGKRDMSRLLAAMQGWSTGNWLEKRAVAAALAEPVLLHNEKDVLEALQILDRITASMQNSTEAGSVEYKVLQQGLGYCWSVLVAAAPQAGKPLMEKWLACPDAAIRRLMQANLTKNRLVRLDPAWIEKWRNKK
ncbi:MAG: HEAT repeat domain-containing protein [Anaerolineales bacterium]